MASHEFGGSPACPVFDARTIGGIEFRLIRKYSRCHESPNHADILAHVAGETYRDPIALLAGVVVCLPARTNSDREVR